MDSVLVVKPVSPDKLVVHAFHIIMAWYIAGRILTLHTPSKIHHDLHQEPMSTASCEGAYGGSLPYMESVFTNCTLVDSVLVVKPVSPDKLVVHAFHIWHGSSCTLQGVFLWS